MNIRNNRFRKFFTIIVLSALIFNFLSCTKDDDKDVNDDCVFEQIDENLDGRIDETEGAILQSCWESRFATKYQIEENLIGDWTLIGHGNGWVHTPSQPCASMTFTNTSVNFKFENEHVNVESIHTWTIEEALNGSFFLKFEPDANPIYRGITVFCENYIYENSTPFDGDMYLYEKER